MNGCTVLDVYSSTHSVHNSNMCIGILLHTVVHMWIYHIQVILKAWIGLLLFYISVTVVQ
jgi:hypothetical protein